MSQSYLPPNPYEQPVVKKDNTTKIILIVLAVVLGVMIVGCGILAALLLPAVSAAREAAKRTMASNNLKMVSLGLLNYEATFRKFPALHGINHADEPTCSWRVSLSPFMESTTVYDQFNFHKAWDSPENQALADSMPEVYRSPLASPEQPPNQTNIFAIRDPQGYMQGGGKYIGMSNVVDGISNTIAFIDLPEYSVPWLTPNDLTIAEALQQIRASKKPEQIQIVMLDGSVRALGTVTDEEFANLVTINDGVNPNF